MLKYTIASICCITGIVLGIGDHTEPQIYGFLIGIGVGMLIPGDDLDYYSRDEG